MTDKRTFESAFSSLQVLYAATHLRKDACVSSTTAHVRIGETGSPEEGNLFAIGKAARERNLFAMGKTIWKREIFVQ